MLCFSITFCEGHRRGRILPQKAVHFCFSFTHWLAGLGSTENQNCKLSTNATSSVTTTGINRETTAISL